MRRKLSPRLNPPPNWSKSSTICLLVSAFDLIELRGELFDRNEPRGEVVVEVDDSLDELRESECLGGLGGNRGGCFVDLGLGGLGGGGGERDLRDGLEEYLLLWPLCCCGGG